MRYILSPIIIIILLMVILISIQTPDLQNNQNKALVGDYNFENVTISFLKNGKKEWELTASKSTVFNDSTKFYLENINGATLVQIIIWPLFLVRLPALFY